jgi:hypothetical protein
LAVGRAGRRLADELDAFGRALAREAIVEFAKEGGTVPGRKAPDADGDGLAEVGVVGAIRRTMC